MSKVGRGWLLGVLAIMLVVLLAGTHAVAVEVKFQFDDFLKVESTVDVKPAPESYQTKFLTWASPITEQLLRPKPVYYFGGMAFNR